MLDEEHYHPCQNKKLQLEDDRFFEINFNPVDSLYEKAFVEDYFTNLFLGNQLSKERQEEDNIDDKLDYGLNPL